MILQGVCNYESSYTASCPRYRLYSLSPVSQSQFSKQMQEIFLRLGLNEDTAFEEFSPRNGRGVTEHKVSGMETRKQFKQFAVINNKNKVIIQAQLPIRSKGSLSRVLLKPRRRNFDFQLC